MLKLSGYKMIDLKGVSIDEVGVTIPGVYDAIESTQKAVLLTGIVINDIEYAPRFAGFESSESTFKTVFSREYDLVVDSDDVVKIVEV